MFAHLYWEPSSPTVDFKTTENLPEKVMDVSISSFAVSGEQVTLIVGYINIKDGVFASHHVSKRIMKKHYPGELQSFWDTHGGRENALKLAKYSQ